MGYYGIRSGIGFFNLFGFLTWLLLVIFLILGIIYFWQEIKKN